MVKPKPNKERHEFQVSRDKTNKKKFQGLFVRPQIKHQKNMVHLSQKPSFNRGNQNAPKCNPPSVILGTIKTLGYIAKSHDDQSDKRRRSRHYYYLQCKTRSGRPGGLSLQQQGPERDMHESCRLLQQIFLGFALPQNQRVIQNYGEEAFVLIHIIVLQRHQHWILQG